MFRITLDNSYYSVESHLIVWSLDHAGEGATRSRLPDHFRIAENPLGGVVERQRHPLREDTVI